MLFQRFFARMYSSPSSARSVLRPVTLTAAIPVLAVLAGLPSCKTTDAKHRATDEANHASPREPPPSSAKSEQKEKQDNSELRAGIIQNLHYIEMTTGGASPSDELPMIVAIHGLGDTPEGFTRLLQDFPAKARIILPRGLDSYDGSFGTGWSWFPFRARDPDIQALSDGIYKASELVANAVRELQKQLPTTGKPLVTGFSQGGMLSFCLAAKFPDVFGVAIPISGWLPPPLWPKSREDMKSSPRIIALHGDADPAVKIEPTRLSVSHLSKLGFDVKLHEFPEVQHEILPPMQTELFRLLNQGVATNKVTKP